MGLWNRGDRRWAMVGRLCALAIGAFAVETPSYAQSLADMATRPSLSAGCESDCFYVNYSSDTRWSAQSDQSYLPDTRANSEDARAQIDGSIAPQIQFRYSQSGFDAVGFIGVDGLLPLSGVSGESLTFLNGQLRASGNQNAIAALQVAHRRRVGSLLLGGYGGIDLRRTAYQSVPQLGIGFEAIAENWALHLNGYLPLTEARSPIALSTAALNPRFDANHLLIDRQTIQQSEVVLSAVDLSGGLQLAQFSDAGSLWGYAGVQYAGGSGTAGRWGGRLRLDYRSGVQWRMGIGVTQNFQGDAQLALSFRWLFDSLERSAHADTLWQHVADPLERQTGGWLTTVTETDRQPGVVAINPATGRPYQFRHVDPATGTATGADAAALTPRDTVANAVGLASAGDIIYVQAGSAGGGFTIPAGVQVRSVGPVQTLVTQAGAVQLPGSGSNTFPSLSGTVTVSSNTLLSGFAIAPSPGAVGILGSNINTVQLESNQVTTTGNNAGAIRLTQADGELSIINNALNTAGASTAFPNGAQALQITWASAANSAAIITGNTIVTTGNNADGLYLETNDSAVVTAAIADNQFPQTGGGGIEIDTDDSSQLNLTIIQNQISNTGERDDGLFIDLNGSSQAAIVVSSNTFSTIGGAIANIDGEAIHIDTEDDAQTVVSILNNAVNTASGDGIFLDLDDRSQITATVSQNNLQNTDDEALRADAEDQVQLTLTASANQITTVNDDGILIDVADTAQVTATVVENAIAQADEDSIDIVQNSTQALCLQLSDNSSTNPGEDGFELDPNGQIFQLVNLGTVVGDNTGSFNFETGIANFTAVDRCL
ncbi:MAG: right-handed parallel beta-helix repeat-containing protein [Cyanobacteria bacterium P01_H01_bin.119]